MQRYSPLGRMFEHENGDYIFLKDHNEKVAQLEADYKRLKGLFNDVVKQREELKEQIKKS